MINSIKWRWLLSFWLVLWLGTAVAEVMPGVNFRGFAVNEGESPRTLVTQVQLDYQLSQYLRDGLLNGMTLEHSINFGLEWHQSWWWNTRRHLASVKAELKYHPLSKQYQLVRLDTGEDWSFSTLIAALEQMGRLEDYTLPQLPESAFGNDASLVVVARLVPKALHLPLKIQALFSDRAALDSEGVMWPIP
ncbi:DUF4390 domain-containing protein [Candidatus Thiothrix anitrata]|uniref:DUF4390 domain-containing protein n=1 Tax=Candidatus Thiothrix anitrata TaxID=2823902 RepID=A0ABX7X5D4_9GAMM|nr:DUF4390 domain-containing protein [Candidatus Thiothrix anitrata]QTR51099.1 DUF4390 domain-containing protein [Candidatus Thiothrix anitrata]